MSDVDSIKGYLYLKGLHHAAEVCSLAEFHGFLGRLQNDPEGIEREVKEAYERSTRGAFTTGLVPQGALPSQKDAAAAVALQKRADEALRGGFEAYQTFLKEREAEIAAERAA